MRTTNKQPRFKTQETPPAAARKPFVETVTGNNDAMANPTDDNPVGLIKTMFPANKESRPKTQELARASQRKPFPETASGTDETTVDPFELKPEATIFNDAKPEATIFSLEEAKLGRTTPTFANVHQFFRTAKVDPGEFAELVTDWVATNDWDERFDLMLGADATIPFLLMQRNKLEIPGVATQVLHHFTRNSNLQFCCIAGDNPFSHPVMLGEAVLEPSTLKSGPIPANLGKATMFNIGEYLRDFNGEQENFRAPFIMPIHPKLATMFMERVEIGPKVMAMLDSAFTQMREIIRDSRNSRISCQWERAFRPLLQYFAHRVKFDNTDDQLRIDNILARPCKDLKQLKESHKKLSATFTKTDKKPAPSSQKPPPDSQREKRKQQEVIDVDNLPPASNQHEAKAPTHSIEIPRPPHHLRETDLPSSPPKTKRVRRDWYDVNPTGSNDGSVSLISLTPHQQPPAHQQQVQQPPADMQAFWAMAQSMMTNIELLTKAAMAQNLPLPMPPAHNKKLWTNRITPRVARSILIASSTVDTELVPAEIDDNLKTFLEATKAQAKDILDHDLRVTKRASCRVDDLKLTTFHNLSIISSDRSARLGHSIFYAGTWRGADAYASNHLEIQIAQEERQLTDGLIRQMASSKMKMALSFPELVIQVTNFYHELCFLFGNRSIVAHRINMFIRWMNNEEYNIRDTIHHHRQEFCLCFLDKVDRGVQTYLTDCMDKAIHDYTGQPTPVEVTPLDFKYIREFVQESNFRSHCVPHNIRQELFPHSIPLPQRQHQPQQQQRQAVQQHQAPRQQQQQQHNQPYQNRLQQNQNRNQAANRTNVINQDTELRIGDMGKFRHLMNSREKPRFQDGDVCMNFHLLTRCPAGPTCQRAHSHRQLTRTEKDTLRKFMDDNLQN